MQHQQRKFLVKQLGKLIDKLFFEFDIEQFFIEQQLFVKQFLKFNREFFKFNGKFFVKQFLEFNGKFFKHG